MTANVVYKGIMVTPLERSKDKILIETINQSDAQKVSIPFKELRDGHAVFQAWVPESELIQL